MVNGECMNNFIKYTWFIGKGIVLTLQLLVGSIVIGFVLGTTIAVLRHFEIGKRFFNSFISIMRGTPVILQLSLVYFSIPGLLGIKLSILSAGILTFGLNSTAYIAEIMRAGIEALPKGQFEAAKTLQISVWYTWKDIIIPQVLRNIFPALINEIVLVLKETSLIATIGGMDIMRSSQILAAEQFTYFMPLCIAGIYYYGMIVAIEYIAYQFEQQGYHVKN